MHLLHPSHHHAHPVQGQRYVHLAIGLFVCLPDIVHHCQPQRFGIRQRRIRVQGKQYVCGTAGVSTVFGTMGKRRNTMQVAGSGQTQKGIFGATFDAGGLAMRKNFCGCLLPCLGGGKRLIGAQGVSQVGAAGVCGSHVHASYGLQLDLS